MSIEVSHLTKHFNGFTAVSDVSFSVETGELVAILGPSGSGKSTMLRMIAGLENPDEGDIRLTGREATILSARERGVGFVFQHYALFKHMTVAENIAFGLEVRKRPKDEIRRRVAELIDLVQLTGLGRRYPSQISGGQRQRVAVARALAPQPRVLLLDEPFGALDAKVREELREWIRQLHRQTNVTTLFVTHDQHEALEIANRIIVMNGGRIEQEGTPLEIYDRPATSFVAEFVGESNYVDTDVREPGVARWGPLHFIADGFDTGEKVRVYFRPNDVYVSSKPETWGVPGHDKPLFPPVSEPAQGKAVIEETRFKGSVIELHLNFGEDRRIAAHVPKGVYLASGFTVGREVYAGVTDYRVFQLLLWKGEGV